MTNDIASYNKHYYLNDSPVELVVHNHRFGRQMHLSRPSHEEHEGMRSIHDCPNDVWVVQHRLLEEVGPVIQTVLKEMIHN